MTLTTEKLRQLLVVPGHVSSADFEKVRTESETQKVDLTAALIDAGLVKDEQLGQLVAEDNGFKFLNLLKEQIDERVFPLIPELVARNRGVIAVAQTKDGIKVGMTNPTDLEIRNLLEKRLGATILPYYITGAGLAEALNNYQSSLKDEFAQTLAQLKDQSLSREARDSLSIKIVDDLLRYGHTNKASDLHLEPQLKEILIRFRIDGVLHDVLSLPKQLADVIITRIKILAKLRTDEHRAAQDGRLSFAAGEDEVDVRVSIVPVTAGENVVLRILSERSRQFSLTDLGLTAADLEKVKRAIKNPHGMILVTGPTGSGKTTTVYAVMKILNQREVHISTIEDPVEYEIPGISQIQVDPKKNLTFATGLRSIVRQDPDIIVVGEIRDQETADIAVNSAMTGHLVLSTIHANDAATTLPRLLDMGIEPFLVASTVNVAMAQRLVRQICEHCRVSYEPAADDLALIDREPAVKKAFSDLGHKNFKNLTLYRGNGCQACNHTGYLGRIGIFEVMLMDEKVKELVVNRAPSDVILKSARASGMTTMLEDGVAKALNGITTLEEVLRVIK